MARLMVLIENFLNQSKTKSELKDYCDKVEQYLAPLLGCNYKEMISFKPEFLKVPSACNNNFKMLKILRDTFRTHNYLWG